MQAASDLRKLLQRGAYSEAFQREAEIQHLLNVVSKDIARRSKDASLRSREYTADTLDAAALLAELYDQTSRYKDAASILSFDSDGSRTLNLLHRQIQTLPPRGEHLSVDSEKQQRYRASAMFCLAHSISLHRQYSKHPEALPRAIQIARKVLRCIEQLEANGFHLSGAHSFASYWLGRFSMLHSDWGVAEEHFSTAIKHQQVNINHHLHEHQIGSIGHAEGSPHNCGSCQSTVFLSNYLVGSCMAFGLAMIRLETGRVSEALTLLRPAALLLDGSTDDRYRKGYVRLLIGTALRIQGGAHVAPLKNAATELRAAVSLFENSSNDIASHAYYATRAYYQLALTQLFLSRAREAKKVERVQALKLTASFLHRAERSHRRCEDEYADFELRVGLPVLKARTIAEVLKYLTTIPEEEFAATVAALAEFKHIGFISMTLDSIRIGAIPSRTSLICHLSAEVEASIQTARSLGEDVQAGRAHQEVVLAEGDVFATVCESLAIYSPAAVSVEDEGALTQARTAGDAAASLALAHVIKLASSSVGNDKIRGSAHVLAARLLLLHGDKAGARRHLTSGWEPYALRVENRMIHDAAAAILDQITPDGYILIPTQNGNHELTINEMNDALHRKLLQNAKDAGLSIDQAADVLGRDPRTFHTWAKKLGVEWRVRNHKQARV